jgi:hypothetical protein
MAFPSNSCLSCRRIELINRKEVRQIATVETGMTLPDQLCLNHGELYDPAGSAGFESFFVLYSSFWTLYTRCQF